MARGDEAAKPTRQAIARASNTLFEEPDWLETVAPGAWGAAEIRDGESIVARLPFVVRANRFFRRLTNAPLTPWLGPWVETPPGAAYREALSVQHDRISALIRQLPRADVAIMPAAPEAQNLLPFYWAGFDLQVYYTYRLDLARGLPALNGEVQSRQRQKIRAAQKALIVRVEQGPEKLIRAIEGTYARQGLKPPPIFPTIERICAAREKSFTSEVLCAEDATGAVHAATLIVWDERCAFYLASGADPALRASNAQALLAWRAVERASERCALFDFEGSMAPGIENAYRLFGARQTPRFTARAGRTHLGRLALAVTDAKAWMARRPLKSLAAPNN